ncbi:MAG: hypothetical protein KGO02_04140, partial [Alphaproteobacteria bacterium]|nr:hypothetical protein [Alphaproteobacteria bacterium]
HAKRNEFHVDHRMLLLNGGTMDIDSPYPYSQVANGLLNKLGVYPVELAKTCDDPEIYKSRQLKPGVYFDKETFGTDRLVLGMAEYGRGPKSPEAVKAFLAKTPLAPKVQRDVLRIETGDEDYLPGLSSDQKKDVLWRMSYKDYLLNLVKADPGVIPYYQHRTDGLWGCGIDAVSAIDSWGVGLPGFQGLKLPHTSTNRMGYTPAGYISTGGSYFFHFPDGNASIARLLVRSLIPGVLSGHTGTDIVTAKADYSRLDQPHQQVRLLLNHVVVRARNIGSARSSKGVEIAYTPSAGGGKVYKVRARNCVLASWNMMLPFICPEMPVRQKAALLKLIKTPLVYVSVALRNWEAFNKLQLQSVYAPGCYYSSFGLNQPINIGSYRSPHDPSEPMLVHMLRTPARPGLPEREQHIYGRKELLMTSLDVFERNIREQLGRTLGAGGFDPARDIEGIAVNRWPHGYAPEYNSLCDIGYDNEHTPNLVGRKRFGRITIANADSGLGAYTSVAIDQAHRAVSELLAL